MSNLTTVFSQQDSYTPNTNSMQASAAVVAKTIISAYPSLLDIARQHGERRVFERTHGCSPAEEKSLCAVLNEKYFMPHDAQLVSSLSDTVDDQLETASVTLPSDDVATTTSWVLQRVKSALPSLPVFNKRNAATIASVSAFLDVCSETIKSDASLVTSTNEYSARVRESFLARMKEEVRKELSHANPEWPSATLSSAMMIL